MKKKFSKKIIIYGGLAIVVLMGLWFVFFRKKEPNLQTITVSPSAFQREVSVAGTVLAYNSADLSFGQTGVISGVNVVPGQFVRAGTVLAALQNSDLQAGVLQSISSLQAEQANLQIVQQGGSPILFNQGINSGLTNLPRSTANSQSLSNFQQAEVNAAAANALGAEATLNKSMITAPFDGMVGRVDAKVGESATPGTVEISLQSGQPFLIESYVPELDIANVAVGNTARVTLDAYGESVPFQATVVSIDPAETVRDNVTTYKVKLLFQKTDPRLKSGMTANVSITTLYRPNEIVIPSGSVYDRAGQRYVQVKSDKEIVEKKVQTGDSSGGMVEIRSGLNIGDQLVLAPNK